MTEDRWDRLARSVADGRVSRRRAIGAFAAGTLATALPTALTPRAWAGNPNPENCAEYCASGGGCTGEESGCCCFDRQVGYQVAGCYDPDVYECVDLGTAAALVPIAACPQGQTACGDECCTENEVCDSARKVCIEKCFDGTKKCGKECCSKGEQCCGGKKCCPKNGRCCGEICCDGKESCCDERCCKQNQKCGASLGNREVECCDKVRQFKQGGRLVCCPKGTIATNDGCCPANKKDCCEGVAALGRKHVCLRGHGIKI